MTINRKIIRTAGICDNHRKDARVCEHQFSDYGARNHFHGRIITFRGFESNNGLRALINQKGPEKFW